MIVELRDEQHQWRETSSSSGWSSGGGASSRKQRTARRLRPPAHRQPLLHNHAPLNAALQGLPRAATTGNAAQQIRAEREAPGHRPPANAYCTTSAAWAQQLQQQLDLGQWGPTSRWQPQLLAAPAHRSLRPAPTMQPCSGRAVGPEPPSACSISR
jgi:hypothetical protein